MKESIQALHIMGVKEAVDYLGVGYTRFYYLIEKYDIPHTNLSCGRVFLKRDLDEFQVARADRLKHRRKDDDSQDDN